MQTQLKVAIAQIAMHWTTAENTASIERAMEFVGLQGAHLCGFSELAITGFHREIAREARAEFVVPAKQRIGALAAHLSLGVAFGAPSFGRDEVKYNSHFLIDEKGSEVAEIAKQGLTEPEATFFTRGSSRPVGLLHGVRCSAVICREIGDLDQIVTDLPPGSVDLIFVPGALRQAPDKPRTDPPEYVRDIARLAEATQAYVVQTNWPNWLNCAEDSVEYGGSVVASPSGEILFRLPMHASGIGIFKLGERCFEWHPC